MTYQRFLYKLFWRRLGMPLILGCGLIAVVTTFYHHTKYKIVEAPPNTQKNQPHPHFNQYPEREKRDKNLKANLFNVDSSKEKQIHEVQGLRLDNKYHLPLDMESRLSIKNKKVAQVKGERLQNPQFQGHVKETIPKVQGKDRNNNDVLGERQVVGGKPDMEKAKLINTETDSSRDSFLGKHKLLIPVKDKAVNKSRIHVIIQPHQKETKPESDKHQQSQFLYKYPSHNKNPKNSSREKMGAFDESLGGNHVGGHELSKQMQNYSKNLPSINQIRLGADKGNSFLKHQYGIPKSHDEQRYQHLQFKQSENIAHVENSDAIVDKPGKSNLYPPNLDKKEIHDVPPNLNSDKQTKRSHDNSIREEIDRKQLETNVIIVNPGPHDEPAASKIQPENKPRLQSSNNERPLEFEEWTYSKQTWCSGHMSGYFNEFVYLRGVILDRAYLSGRAGGEEINSVLNQPEEDEYYKYDLGCFQLACKERPQYFFNGGYHLSEFLFNLKTKEISHKVDEVRKKFTIVVTRYEYANIYHTMTDWYNAFLMMKFFNKTREETEILLVDAHPKGALDSTWNTLFTSAIRLSDLRPRTRFTEMTWSILGYDSLMLNHYLETLPLIDQFHTFFLSSFNIKTKPKVNCDKVKITFVWRRDYLAHPRNPSGVLSRKIKNEKELLKSVRKKYPNFDVSGVQIDKFNMDTQLRLISETDILIGMHGAGLTHAMFLPSHAGLIELVPSYWSSAMDHFMAIAQWRNLHYERWVNNDPHDEVPNESTLVPPGVVQVFIKSILRKMKCIEDLGAGQYDYS